MIPNYTIIILRQQNKKSQFSNYYVKNAIKMPIFMHFGMFLTAFGLQKSIIYTNFHQNAGNLGALQGCKKQKIKQFGVSYGG